MGPTRSKLQILLVLQIKMQLRAGALPSKASIVFLWRRNREVNTVKPAGKKYVDALSHKPPEKFHVFTR